MYRHQSWWNASTVWENQWRSPDLCSNRDFGGNSAQKSSWSLDILDVGSLPFDKLLRAGSFPRLLLHSSGGRCMTDYTWTRKRPVPTSKSRDSITYYYNIALYRFHAEVLVHIKGRNLVVVVKLDEKILGV